MSEIRLIYTSTAVDLLDREGLERLTEAAAKNNGRDGITGMLLYGGGYFLQVLEGQEEAVRSTFSRVAGDPRHLWVSVLLDEPIRNRMFPDWSMDFCDFDEHDEHLRGKLGVVAEFMRSCATLDVDDKTSGVISYFISAMRRLDPAA